MPYQWIFLDSTGTLMTPDPEPARVYHQIAQQHGSRLAVEEIRLNLRAAMLQHFFGETANDPTDDNIELGRWQKIVGDTLSDLDGNSLTDAFSTLWTQFASADAWRLYDDVLPTIERLKSRGYLIAVASNFDVRLRTVLKGMQIESQFDDVLISSDLGWSKPNPRFYEAGADRIGVVDRSTLLMIGDTLRGDVQAAQQAGLHARHLIRDQSDALAKLTKDL